MARLQSTREMYTNQEAVDVDCIRLWVTTGKEDFLGLKLELNDCSRANLQKDREEETSEGNNHRASRWEQDLDETMKEETKERLEEWSCKTSSTETLWKSL